MRSGESQLSLLEENTGVGGQVIQYEWPNEARKLLRTLISSERKHNQSMKGKCVRQEGLFR